MKILAVDDEFVALTKIQTMLSEYGYCDPAKDGQEALLLFEKAYLAGEKYDLITIDIEMPRIDGMELLKRISEYEDTMFIPKAKKIIVTAEGSPSNVLKAMENQCDAFLIKPVKKDRLEAKLSEFGMKKRKPKK